MRTNRALHPHAISILLLDPSPKNFMWFGADCPGLVDVIRFLPSADPERPVSWANLQRPIDVGRLNGFDVDNVHRILRHFQIALERHNPLGYSRREISKSRVNMRSLSKICISHDSPRSSKKATHTLF